MPGWRAGSKVMAVPGALEIPGKTRGDKGREWGEDNRPVRTWSRSPVHVFEKKKRGVLTHACTALGHPELSDPALVEEVHRQMRKHQTCETPSGQNVKV